MKNNRIFILNNPYAPRLNAELAQEIGLNESILLLQIEYWISVSKHIHDGYTWTYQSASSIKELFKFYSTSTINRTLKNLLEMGLLIESNYNKKKFDRTRWFALNYENLAKLKSIKISGYDYESFSNNDLEVLEIDTNQNEQSTSQIEQSITQIDPCQTQNDSRQNQNESRQTQNESTIPKTTTKNKDIKDSQGSKNDPQPSLKKFDDEVYKITNKFIDKISANHPKIHFPKKDDVDTVKYTKWAHEIDKLHRIGPPGGKSGYSYQEIENIAKWALNDPFWLIHIQSTAKFRAKIITLEAQYKASLNKASTSMNKPKQSNANNKFHNFEQRKKTYSNSELEKMLGVRN